MTHPMDDTFDEDEDDLRDDEEEEDRWVCIGDDCLNPHFLHLRYECFTEEMVKDWHDEMSKEPRTC